ncbi:hypothetical protein J2T17_000407 [Paenibacillus mucilaginosus]|uniref:hypothetical protein n=1 Tax=Paenibacillus mucilaginosus TaxID=61624 RepID=UPI003D1F1461
MNKRQSRRRKHTVRSLTAALLLAAMLAGCSAAEEAGSRLTELKDGVAGAVSGLRESLGASVATLDAVNGQVVQGASKLILLLEEWKFDLSYRENGIAFTSGQGLSGLVGVSGNTLVLDVSSSSSDAAAAKTIIRIANVFSPNSAVEEKIGAFVGKDTVQEAQLPGGFLRSDGKTMELHLETPLLQ